jgi:hypothetical protein
MNKITSILTVGFVMLSFQIPAEKVPSIKVLNNGNVGINTARPAYKLDINSIESRSYYPGKNALHINHQGVDPRLCSAEKIVFFRNDGGGHAKIEFRASLQAADRELMENILSLENKGISTILRLHGFSFDYRGDQSSRKEYGFIAQDVETVIAEAVYSNDSANCKLLSYNSILPFLVEANKELYRKIEELTSKISTLEDLIKKDDFVTTQHPFHNSPISTQKARLQQNVPNPFSNVTYINCLIPENSKSCKLHIINQVGVLVKSYRIDGEGFKKLEINGNEMSPGIYSYKLMVGDKNVDSRKMLKINSLVNTDKHEDADIYTDFSGFIACFFANRAAHL